MVFTKTHIFEVSMCHPETYSEPCQTSKIEYFLKRVSDYKPLTIFAKCYILDIKKVVKTPMLSLI